MYSKDGRVANVRGPREDRRRGLNNEPEPAEPVAQFKFKLVNPRFPVCIGLFHSIHTHMAQIGSHDIAHPGLSIVVDTAQQGENVLLE